MKLDMTRSSWLIALVLLVCALGAGFVPAPAAAAATPWAALERVSADRSDAMLSADVGTPLLAPAPRYAASGAALPSIAPRLVARVDLPSPVRTAHHVDGLSLPLLR